MLTVISSLVILQKYDDIPIQMMKLYGSVMFVIWATVAGVLTFDGPFRETGKFAFSFQCTNYDVFVGTISILL